MGYDKKNKAIRMSPGILGQQTYGVRSNAADMVRWLQANIAPERLPEPMRSAVVGTHIGYFKAGNMVQGLGWEQFDYPVTLERLLDGNSYDMIMEPNPALRLDRPRIPAKPTLFDKTGSMNGFGNYLAFVPTKRIGIVLLANKNYPIPARIKARTRSWNSWRTWQDSVARPRRRPIRSLTHLSESAPASRLGAKLVGMSTYRRNRVPGHTFLFSVRLSDPASALLTEHISAFGEAIRLARSKRPFHVDAWVVLHNHSHAIWTLPPGDHDCASRWRAVKIAFSKAVSKACAPRQLQAIWESHYRERRIGNDEEYRSLVDYVHENPVAHGMCDHPADWPWSSVHRFAAEGLLPPAPPAIHGMN